VNQIASNDTPTTNGWTFADVWEVVADAVPDADALVHDGAHVTWQQFEQRANAVARFLLDAGCGHQSKVAFYLFNRPEYCELFFACSKASLVHVNTNYRYADAELVYIWDNADTEVVVFGSSFTETTERIRNDVPTVHTWLWVDDGDGSTCPSWATPYEDAATAAIDHRVVPARGRSGDDLVLLYTGGTTGMPKGVMWRQDDLFKVTDAPNKVPMGDEVDLDALRARTLGPGPISLPACPLMHGTGLFNAVNTLSLGGAIVTLASTRFVIDEFLDTLDKERVKSTFIVGDAFAKPMLAALDAEPERWDLSALRVIISSGVMWGAESKQGLMEHWPQLILVDTYGSSEAIGMGSSVSSKSNAAKTASFSLSDRAAVLTDDGRVVEPGSGEIGKVGIRGRTPIGYYKDEAKSAATFPVVNGVRYSIPGDFATVEADGSITLLGRGSVCINTGGEKVFPEEVEEVLKRFPGIDDAIAVGVPDDRFGQAVTAVVASPIASEIDEAAVIDHVKAALAHYKAPKRVFVVDSLDRAANGKIDYKRWTTHAEGEATSLR
jgi:acyl-CoA synthetase (AMP-forming)/AMP-acid ligase II